MLRLTILFLFLQGLSSCSVYRSTGRKNFESKAPQNNVKVSSRPAPAAMAALESICWDQPANEPLWGLVESTTMSVTKINEDEIQVCTLPL